MKLQPLLHLAICLLGIDLPGVLHAGNDWLGPLPPGIAYPAGEDDRQYAILEHDLAQREKVNRYPDQTLRADALIAATDRDPLDVVLRRTAALLAHVTQLPGARDFSKEMGELQALIAQAGTVGVANSSARRDLFKQAVRLRRRIAFANPLLSFKEIVVLKRQVASVYEHMCDQFYGIAQEPGGGLFVLSDPFGATPAIRDLLHGAPVQNGRLAGRTIDGGPRRRWPNPYRGDVSRAANENPTELSAKMIRRVSTAT